MYHYNEQSSKASDGILTLYLRYSKESKVSLKPRDEIDNLRKGVFLLALYRSMALMCVVVCDWI